MIIVSEDCGYADIMTDRMRLRYGQNIFYENVFKYSYLINGNNMV